VLETTQEGDGSRGKYGQSPTWSGFTASHATKGLPVSYCGPSTIRPIPTVTRNPSSATTATVEATRWILLRQTHRASEKLFLDFFGQTMPVVVQKTGEIQNAQIVVAVLGALNKGNQQINRTEIVA
jgi:hypothetical protein